VCFGPGVRLDFNGEHFPELTIECPLEVASADGSRWVGEPLSADAAAQLLPLLLTPVRAAEVDDGGGLRLGFGDGVQIRVPADDNYEAWQMRRDDGALIVSRPGGDLAIWRTE
jgi:uncharacterized protein DUF6188